MKLLPLIAAVFCTALLCVALRVGATTSRTVADRAVGPSLSAAPATRVGSPPSPVRDLSSHRPHPSSHPHLNWNALAACESSGNWQDTAGYYEGGVQFAPTTWVSFHGTDFAPHAYQATRREQIVVAERVLRRQGLAAWPACTAKLGWR